MAKLPQPFDASQYPPATEPSAEQTRKERAELGKFWDDPAPPPQVEAPDHTWQPGKILPMDYGFDLALIAHYPEMEQMICKYNYGLYFNKHSEFLNDTVDTFDKLIAHVNHLKDAIMRNEEARRNPEAFKAAERATQREQRQQQRSASKQAQADYIQACQDRKARIKAARDDWHAVCKERSKALEVLDERVAAARAAVLDAESEPVPVAPYMIK